MNRSADPNAIADDLLARTRIERFTHRGRPCLALSLPTGGPEDMIATALLVTEGDGTLTSRGLVGLGYPDRARLAAAASEPPVRSLRDLALFTGGLGGAPGAARALASAAGRIARDLPQAPTPRTVEARVAGPLSARLVEALDRSGLAPQHVRALSGLARIARPGSALVKVLLGPPEPWRAAVAACCERSPVLTEIVSFVTPPDAGLLRDRLGDGPETLTRTILAEFEATNGPGLTAGRLGRLGGAGIPPDAPRSHDLDAFLRLLRDAPIDWIRPDPTAIGAMLGLAPAYGRLALYWGEDAPTLLKPARGDWPAFLARCLEAGRDTGRAGGEDLPTRAADVSDMLNHFARRVMLPLLARTEPPADGFPPGYVARTMEAARVMLLADKGLPAVLEASALWHAQAGRIEARIPSGAAAVWDPPCPPFRSEDGIEVRPLSSAMDLVEEGAAGLDAEGVPGLAHCVASYRTLAQSGQSHILSVRSADGRRRLSTVEVKVDDYGRARVVQHRGLRNAPAPPEAVRAVGEFVTATRLPVPVAAPAPQPLGRIAQDCGYDWRDDALLRLAVLAYAEFLPRDLRDADLDRLAQRAGFGLPDPAADADADSAAPQP